MAVETRKERLRAIWRQTLNEQWPVEAGAVDLSGDWRQLPGPWDACFEEHSANPGRISQVKVFLPASLSHGTENGLTNGITRTKSRRV
jgi:hypothetical protein